MLQTATGLAVSLAICKVGSFLTEYFNIQGGTLPMVTAIVVLLATLFPRQFAYLAPSGEAMALILMQVTPSPYRMFARTWLQNQLNLTSLSYSRAPGIFCRCGCKWEHSKRDHYSTQYLPICFSSGCCTSCRDTWSR